ncbi:Intracellular endo-alpha-(1-_5)-L-arabinanase [Choanephora cucurbitarum]|uniref:Arabinan endo-1,5-alpha-L-arabinosidase n=1 Tax=Choanephora cucurbitarum TaxID=101091 RepID=A0A1C7MXV2_9FUNG|nr:Intracellular endo-alpha-(1->5)-L-arabinanase [Choanephora cucurbitarum]
MKKTSLALLLQLFVTQISAAWPPAPGPVKGDIYVHDPAMIKRGSNYYLFGTHDDVNIKKSSDRTNFKSVGAAVPWMGKTDVWAPDVSEHNGQYWLYYSTSTFGTQNSCIYMATSSTLEPGSYSNKGQVICSKKGDPYNAIDPNFVRDVKGNNWLSFGSFYGGIYVVQLDGTGKVKSGAKPTLIAKRAFPDAMEGPFIYVKNNMYYLFTSWGNCCVDPTNVKEKSSEPYHIKVCRAKSITGPYVDAAGAACTNGGGLEVLKGQSGIWGVGGQGVMKDGNQDVLYYHYYDSKSNYAAKLGVNLLKWDSNGWPVAY